MHHEKFRNEIIATNTLFLNTTALSKIKLTMIYGIQDEGQMPGT